MPLTRFEHYFVYASDLERSRHFYEEILGLENGPRPDFDFPGFWFYLDGGAVVHVGNSDFEGGYVKHDEVRKITGGTGPLDHIAFRGTDIDEFELSRPFSIFVERGYRVLNKLNTLRDGALGGENRGIS